MLHLMRYEIRSERGNAVAFVLALGHAFRAARTLKQEKWVCTETNIFENSFYFHKHWKARQVDSLSESRTLL